MEMEPIKLTETEQRYFGELFTGCDVENSGKVSAVKAYELFLGAQLSQDVLNQISDMCGAKRLGHFGRSQFYIALKLIAAAQMGHPLKPDTLNSGIEIPLPKFTRVAEGDKRWQQPQQPFFQPVAIGDQDLMHLQNRQSSFSNQLPAQLPPPPSTKCGVRNNTVSQRPTSLFVVADDTLQFSQSQQISQLPGSESRESSPDLPIEQMIPSTIDSSTPTNVINASQEVWHQFEEDRQLLGTEEESSDRHSSDEDYDIWTITDEQREYYTNQFKSMQPDLNGLLSGAVAKEFFEKSKLPIQELSKIWQLSDINKDGALSLEEFFTAMHLVVLRRNKIELPNTLPPSLVPRIPNQLAEENNFNTQQVSGSPSRSPVDTVSPHTKEWTRFYDSPTSSVSSPGIKPVNFDFQKSAVEQDPKILHPVALRLSPDNQRLVEDSEVAAAQLFPAVSGPDSIINEQMAEQQKSPSKRLVNSDSQEFKAVLPQTVVQRPIPKKPSAPGPGALPPPPQISAVSSIDETVDGNAQPCPISLMASNSINSFPPQSQAHLPQGPKKDPPPPPPPRPKKNHARSSSLDLNRLAANKGVPPILGAPPALPPRMSPSTMTPKKLMGQKSEPDVVTLLTDQANFADFAQFSQELAASGDVLQLKSGAFEVYRRPDQAGSGMKTGASAPSSTVAGLVGHKSPDVNGCDETDHSGDINKESGEKQSVSLSPPKCLDKRDLRSVIRVQREKNSELFRLNSELNQELSEVMEERIALEIQLEHLKPFST